MSSAVKRFNVVKTILNKSIFDENIIHIILKYYWQLLDKSKVLLPWIDIEWLSWDILCYNPNAIDLLENNQDKIDWQYLSRNPNAIELLTNNQDKIDWSALCYNQNAIELLTNNQDKIYWHCLSGNSNAIELLTNNQDKIYWHCLSRNPNAIDLLEKRIEYENNLSVENYNNLRTKIDWFELSANRNAIHLLEANQDKIEVYNNDILLENPDKISFDMLSVNPSIFEDEPMPIV